MGTGIIMLGGGGGWLTLRWTIIIPRTIVKRRPDRPTWLVNRLYLYLYLWPVRIALETNRTSLILCGRSIFMLHRINESSFVGE